MAGLDKTTVSNRNTSPYEADVARERRDVDSDEKRHLYRGPGVVLRWTRSSYSFFVFFPELAKRHFEWQLVIFLNMFGGLIGCLMSAHLVDRYGRKSMLMANCLFSIAGVVFLGSTALIRDFTLLAFGYFFFGLHMGVSTAVAPIYLHEIAPTSLRGTVCVYHQLMIALGIFCSHSIALPEYLGRDNIWPFIYVVCIIPTALQLILLRKCPESPKYNLIMKNYIDTTERDLCKLRKMDNTLAEIFDLRAETLLVAASERVSFRNLFEARLRWTMISSIVLTLIQPMSGVMILLFVGDLDLVIHFSSEINHEVIAKALGHLLAVIVAINLVDHRRCGRRLLLLSGIMGMILCLIVLTLSLVCFRTESIGFQNFRILAIGSIHFCVICYAFGPGPIPTFIVTELFDTGARATAQSLTIAVHFCGNVVVFVYYRTFIKKAIETWHTQYFFTPFIILLIFFYAFVYFFIPESNGRLVNEILDDFNARRVHFRELVVNLFHFRWLRRSDTQILHQGLAMPTVTTTQSESNQTNDSRRFPF